jgi:hypothetical protein
MFEHTFLAVRRAGAVAAVAGLLFCSAAVQAKPSDSESSEPIGRINFENAELPPANVELDLGDGMFRDLFGISDAAVAGVAETLLKFNRGEHAEASKMAAEQLGAARQIIELASKVVKEVRVRAYEKKTEDLSSHFDKQIRDGEWEKTVVVRQGDENARVYVIRKNESIRGIFVVAGSHDGQALVNVVCDLSPENVKSLTSAATKIGLDNGLLMKLEAKFRQAHGGPMPPAPPRPAKAPRPPAPPKPVPAAERDGE